MTLFRRTSQDRARVARIEGTPLAVRIIDVPDMAASDVPPRPGLSALGQWGIHDARFDPTGAPPLNRKSGAAS